jgi:hypothetical protein
MCPYDVIRRAQYNYVEYATSERGVKGLVFTQRRGIEILGSPHSPGPTPLSALAEIYFLLVC